MTVEPSWDEHPEKPAWDAWERGENRCPFCIGLAMEDFEAVCDCSRYSLETTGKPLVIQVIGMPETASIVLPRRIVK